MIDQIILPFFCSLQGNCTDIPQDGPGYTFRKIFCDIWAKITDWWAADGTNFLLSLSVIIILLIITFFIERISTRLNRRYGRKKEWADEIINGVAFMSRLLIIIIGIGLVTAFGGLPEEFGLTITAITGAAIGLASTKTIGNIMSGFNVLFSRPINMGDYVKIGDVEGIITEVTINYTKLITSKDRTILISNQSIQNKNIIRYGTDNLNKTYTIYPEFNHDLTTAELKRVFKKVIKKYVPDKVISMKYELISVTRLARKYEVSFVFDFVDDYFTIPSDFLEDLMHERDKTWVRKQKRKKK